MDELRLSLLALFVALIAGIYLRDFLRKRRSEDAEADHASYASDHADDIDDMPVSDDDLREPGHQDEWAAAETPADYASSEPAPSPDAELERFEESTGVGDDPDAWPASPAEAQPGIGVDVGDDDVAAVPAFSADGRDVPLGDIDLLEPGYDAALGEADRLQTPDPLMDPASFMDPELMDPVLMDDEPFSQGQLDLEGIAANAGPPRAPARPASANDLIVVLHVMRADREPMTAGLVQAALGTAQLELGEMSIYHHYGLTEGGAHQPVFSVARAVEPGTFDPEDESSYVTPGLTMFMRLPGPQDGAVVLELMFNTAQTLARDLEAQVLDELRNPLSAQALNHLRDRVAEFSRRQKLVNS